MPRTSMPRATRAVVEIIRPWVVVFTKHDWRGTENLPTGGFVLAPNHLSHLDPLVISHFMVNNGVAPRFLVKDTLMNLRGIGAILHAAEQIPVYRSTGGAAQSLRAATAAVEAGHVVTIYPEGTITRDPAAWPMSGRTGAVRVALATGKPLVPLMQWGAQDILWPYARIPRLLPRKMIHIRVGEPVDLSGFTGKKLTEELLDAATSRLMDTLTAMMSEVRGGLPSTPRIDVHTLGRPRTTYKH